MRRALVVYAWDGISPLLEFVDRTDSPDFDLLIFDYSGAGVAPDDVALLSVKTECKGEIFREVHRHVAAIADRHDYIALLDDDIETSWHDLNRLLQIARTHALDAFVASLSRDSFYSHAQFLHVPGSDVRPIDWIEVMMPFYRTELFLAGAAYYADTISSYGIDQFGLATVQKLRGLDRVAVIDAVVVKHGRAITSDDKVFANGRNAHQERALARARAMAQVAAERPDLLGSRWYFQTFAPWGGPVKFWLLRLQAPWLWLRALPWRRTVPRAQPGTAI